MDNKDYIKKFRRCILEYTNAAGSFDISEEGEEETMQQEPQTDMNQDTGGAVPGGEEMNPEMGGEPEGVEGFNPESEMTGSEGMNPEMGGEMPTDNEMNPDDEVIDVDDLTKSQESAEKKIDKMNAKFEKLMGAVEVLIKQNAEREKETANLIAATEKKVSDELDKRIPTPQQRMTMRSTKSYPYSMTPNEYMNNYAPSNYSDEDDNNGADDVQYQITKGDIDNFTDYASIAKELDVEHQGLHDILGL